MTTDVSLPEKMTLNELAVRYGPVELQKPLSSAEYLALAERYPDLQMEREQNGIVTIMSPVKKGSGRRESRLFMLLTIWWYQHRKGELFGATTGFDLPDGSNKAPDVAWLSDQSMALDPSTEEEFLHIVPDFVGEIRSSTDRLSKLQKKMTDTWIANGVRLAWLIDPYEEKAYIYRPDRVVEVVEGFDKMLHGENVLEGFELPLTEMKRRT
ncbi:MAG: Uma2 family endonuclease [Saprospiraceae bacterium]|jgi:Uma2 family endonuclease|nr:Uma2 family endonuclease [Saprospiraceae bacterium]